MITEELGADFVNEKYAHRWFRRLTNGAVCRLEAIGRNKAQVLVLKGENINDATYADDLENVPTEEFEDMAAFQYPELGYRSSPDGVNLWMLSRIITHRRGLYEGNLKIDNLTVARAADNLSDAQKAMLVFNPVYVPFHEALAKLNAAPKVTRGIAMSHQFAVSRAALGNMEYKIHFSGKIVGTVSKDGTVNIASRAVQRLFDKEAA